MRTGKLALERNDAGLAVVTISGEHDLSTAPNLRRRLDSLLDEETATVVDLSPATFIDSSILGVILDSRRRAADANIGFAVVHANGAEAVSIEVIFPCATSERTTRMYNCSGNEISAA